jgi:hypothetical protein
MGSVDLQSEIGEVLAQIKANQIVLAKKQACIGFDGFIDSIINVVKQKSSDQQLRYFDTIEEFGTFLQVRFNLNPQLG